MRVEKAGTEDIAALVEMRIAYLQEDNGDLEEEELLTIQRDLPGYFQKHLDSDLSAYVIRNGQEIVSCAFLLTVEKPMSPAFLNGKTGTVLNVYTRPEDRRKGYANAIMRKLLNDAKEQGISVIELKSTEDGYPLYRSLGFAEEDSRYRKMIWKNL